MNVRAPDKENITDQEKQNFAWSNLYCRVRRQAKQGRETPWNEQSKEKNILTSLQ